jgi:hypothetical protein
VEIWLIGAVVAYLSNNKQGAEFPLSSSAKVDRPANGGAAAKNRDSDYERPLGIIVRAADDR